VARFRSPGVPMAADFLAWSLVKTLLDANRSISRNARCCLHLIHIIFGDSQSFPAFSKNESLLLQCFRQTLRLHNGQTSR
jgi:hypothetical protein